MKLAVVRMFAPMKFHAKIYSPVWHCWDQRPSGNCMGHEGEIFLNRLGSSLEVK